MEKKEIPQIRLKWEAWKILGELKGPSPVPGCCRTPREKQTGACLCPNLPPEAGSHPFLVDALHS